MEMDSRYQQTYECIGYRVEIYSDIFQKEEETMKGSISLHLMMNYQGNLVKREPKESEHRNLEVIIFIEWQNGILGIRQSLTKIPYE